RRDRTVSATGSRSRLLLTPGLKDANQILEPLAFKSQHTAAQGSEPVVTTPRIVELGCRALARFDDESFLNEALQRAVQRRRPQAHFALAALEHVLDDRVAVLFAADEGHEDVEPVALEREKGLRCTLRHQSISISYNIYISQDQSDAGPGASLRDQ